MDPSELEQRVMRELRQLPRPVAPSTLVPRVMLAVRRAAARPWYARAWMTWPRAWQVASFAVLVLTVVTLGLAGPDADGAAGRAIERVFGPATAWLTRATAGPRAWAGAMDVLWRALVQPVAGYLLALVLMMWTACVVFGVAVTRVAFGEGTES